MSDDSTPTPSLRLKPRLRPESSPEAGSSVLTPGQQAGAGEMPTLRLKPRNDGALVDPAPELPELPTKGAGGEEDLQAVAMDELR